MIQLHDVDLKLLRVFTTIVRCGGFSAAQAALNAGQSTISEQMTHLETRLGVKLCQRGRSGFRLTEQGVAIHEATLRLLSAVESFCLDADVLKQHISGKLNLGIIDSTLTDPVSPLPRTTQRFVSRGHDAHLHIYIGAPAELEERVLDGRLHLAIGHFPLRVPGLSYLPLYDEALGLYCGRRHPLFASNAANGRLMEDVRQSRIVVRGYMQQYDLEQLGIAKADATVENIEAAAILIISGAYIDFFARALCRAVGQDGRNASPGGQHAGPQLTLRSGDPARSVAPAHPAGLSGGPGGLHQPAWGAMSRRLSRLGPAAPAETPSMPLPQVTSCAPCG